MTRKGDRKGEDTETQSSVPLGGEKNLVNVNINILDNLSIQINILDSFIFHSRVVIFAV